MKTHVCLAILLSLASYGSVHAAVLTFDDLGYEHTVTGSAYAGLTWETGNAGLLGNPGYWGTTPAGHNYPYSPPNSLVNVWGSTMIGIGFSSVANIQGAYIAGQGAPESWTTGVRVHGYRSGAEIALTGWFTNIGSNPVWFQMSLTHVDRIVFESVPVNSGGGWYGLDNLTFYYVPEPSSTVALLCGVAAMGGIILRRRSA